MRQAAVFIILLLPAGAVPAAERVGNDDVMLDVDSAAAARWA